MLKDHLLWLFNVEFNFQNVHDFFHMSYKMEVMPPFWKYYKTPAYKKTMNIMNSMTE